MGGKMKELLFSKDESNFIKECLKDEIDTIKSGLYGQDMELTREREKKSDILASPLSLLSLDIQRKYLVACAFIKLPR